MFNSFKSCKRKTKYLHIYEVYSQKKRILNSSGDLSWYTGHFSFPGNRVAKATSCLLNASDVDYEFKLNGCSKPDYSGVSVLPVVGKLYFWGCFGNRLATIQSPHFPIYATECCKLLCLCYCRESKIIYCL